ncbi:MAG: TonB family protein [Acidobacteriota bacterium]
MLKTLDNYIESKATERDRRFARILAASVVCHIVFWSVVIRLDIWTKWEETRAAQPELVVVAEIAPPPERPLRATPEKLDRVDKENLKFDPRRADDINLVARSPKLGSPAGKQTGSVKPQTAKSSASPAPPAAADDKRLIAIAPPLPVVTAQTPAQTSNVPAASLPTQTTAAPPAPPAQSGQQSEREERQGTRELSLQTIESQYLAYVRARIRQANERIMPADWIRDVLTQRVSADFEIMIARSGQLLSARLTRSSGYPTLDDAARQAIYIARPFEGYPPGAGDTLTLKVTVYYAPSR